MKRREFIKDASLVGFASIMPLNLKLAAMEAITPEEKLSILLMDMPTGGIMTVYKTGKEGLVVYGTGIDEAKWFK